MCLLGSKIQWRARLEQDVRQLSRVMDKILLISSNQQLVRDLTWRLQDAGFIVVLSTSLEESFLEVDPTVPSLVIVDDDATPDEWWQTRKFLGWFHHRSPVLLLSNRGCEGMEEECDRCFPKTAYQEKLLSYIQQLAY